jgi:hypothetical protein
VHVPLCLSTFYIDASRFFLLDNADQQFEKQADIMANNGNGERQGEAVNTDIITLTRFLTEEQTKHKEATGDFTYA